MWCCGVDLIGVGHTVCAVEVVAGATGVVVIVADVYDNAAVLFIPLLVILLLVDV